MAAWVARTRAPATINLLSGQRIISDLGSGLVGCERGMWLKSRNVCEFLKPQSIALFPCCWTNLSHQRFCRKLHNHQHRSEPHWTHAGKGRLGQIVNNCYNQNRKPYSSVQLLFATSLLLRYDPPAATNQDKKQQGDPDKAPIEVDIHVSVVGIGNNCVHLPVDGRPPRTAPEVPIS